ncbi:hypothetical protein GCM10020000_65580 [Streptomyces olivoverticillatus]
MAPRPPRSRLRRTLLAALVIGSVTLPVLGAARPAAVPAPAPSALAPLRAATPAALAERYAATRADIRAAERAATDHGDLRRAAALHAMAEPARHFLSFDGRDGGRTAEVFGDLSRAERTAVLVPGSDTSLDRYGRLQAGATALQRQLGDRSAVVAWLGYRTPATVSLDAVTPRPRRRRGPGAAAVRRRAGRAQARHPDLPAVPLLRLRGLRPGRVRPRRRGRRPLRQPRHRGRHRRRAAHPGHRLGRAAAPATGSPRCPTRTSRSPSRPSASGRTPSRRASAPGSSRRATADTATTSPPGSVSLANIARIVSGRTPAEEGRHA